MPADRTTPPSARAVARSVRLAGPLALAVVCSLVGGAPPAAAQGKPAKTIAHPSAPKPRAKQPRSRPAPSRGSPFLMVPEPGVAEATPAYRYANMSDDEAVAELDRRGILYTREMPVPGVRTPIRLTGRLHGVHFHSSLSPDERVQSPFEILDARLALAIDDFAAILERHDIDEVVHYTMYRPNVARDHGMDEGLVGEAPAAHGARASAALPDARRPAPAKLEGGSKGKAGAAGRTPKQKIPGAGRTVAQSAAPGASRRTAQTARKASGTGVAAPQETRDTTRGPRSRPTAPTPPPAPPKTSWAPPGTRHPAGLAIDVGGLKKRDGHWLSVAAHFQGHIGDKTCGEGAHVADTPEARELRSIVCESADLGVFTYVLTPNYNAAHVDHYHMEIKPQVRWFLYH